MDLDAFYADIYDMVDDIPTSSQPSQQLLEEVFEDAARAGDQVCGIFISTGLSGAYRRRLARHPSGGRAQHRFQVGRSSTRTSCGFDEALSGARGCGRTRRGRRSCAAWPQAALDAIERTRFLFTPESLTFLQKGGRIGGAAALLGNLIQLVAGACRARRCRRSRYAKVRTRKKALRQDRGGRARPMSRRTGLTRRGGALHRRQGPGGGMGARGHRAACSAAYGQRAAGKPGGGAARGPGRRRIAYECAHAISGKLTGEEILTALPRREAKTRPPPAGAGVPTKGDAWKPSRNAI